MTEPMDDAELAALRHIHEREGLSLYPPGNTAFDRLFARLDAERTRADAAEARALPEPRLLRTVDEVEALPEGRYFIHNENQHTVVLDRFPSFAGTLIWLQLGGQGYFRESDWIVGRPIAGPIPDLPTPTAAQEG